MVKPARPLRVFRNPPRSRLVRQYDSLRGVREQIAKADASKFLNTDILGKVLPTISSKYGKGKALDFLFSLNTEIFSEGLTSSPLPGLSIGPNGDITVNLNVHVDLRLKGDKPVSIRHFYIPLEVKLNAREPIAYDALENKVSYSVGFVDVAIKGMKVYSLDPPKLENNEALLIQSAVIMQLQPHLKKYKGKTFSGSFSVGAPEKVKEGGNGTKTKDGPKAKVQKAMKCLGIDIMPAEQV